jgi:ABC-type glutathione transport system ATPase component
LIDSVPEIGERHVQGGRQRRLLSAAPATTRVRERSEPERATLGDPILQLDGVSKDFVIGGVGTGRHKSKVTAVRDVSLTVRRGETFGLIGESGSGKSTLARLSGALLPLTSGSATFDGVDVSATDKRARRDLRRRFQYVFQDPATALNPRVTAGDQIARPLLRLGKAASRKDAAVLTAQALELVGLGAGYADRYPREFSGGQRQRVGIARAIALEPDLLILDEPTSALDVSTQARILNLLLDLKEELDLTYLFIGHNLAVIEFVCDRIGVMEQGSLIETFSADDLFADDREPATQALLAAVLPLRGRSGRAGRAVPPHPDDGRHRVGPVPAARAAAPTRSPQPTSTAKA